MSATWLMLGYLLMALVLLVDCKGYFEIYGGNEDSSDRNHKRKPICEVSVSPTKLDKTSFKRLNEGKENKCRKYAETSSMKLCYAAKGTTITLYANKMFETNNDYAIISVEENMDGCIFIDSFEKDRNMENITITFTKVGRKQLDGKVGSIEIKGVFS